MARQDAKHDSKIRHRRQEHTENYNIMRKGDGEQLAQEVEMIGQRCR